jgi:Xaa-Pro aminopeptidase
MQPAASPMFADRLAACRGILDRTGVEVLLLFAVAKDPAYVQWLTGIRPRSWHYAYVTPNDVGFLEIDYNVPGLQAMTDLPVKPIAEDMAHRDIAALFGGAGRIALAGPAPFEHLRDVHDRVIVVGEQLDPLLCRKAPLEIAAIRRSAEVTKRVLEVAASIVRPGSTERDVAAELRRIILSEADDLAFPITVLSGDRLRDTTAGRPSDRRIGQKDVVCVDLGAVLNGFYSDATRMLSVGDAQAAERIAALSAAHADVVAGLRADVMIRDLPERYRSALSAHGLPGDTLVAHELGHGIGFRLHEAPLIYTDAYSSYALSEGMVFTLEPEIIFPERRLRIEDMVWMSPDGPVTLT